VQVDLMMGLQLMKQLFAGSFQIITGITVLWVFVSEEYRCPVWQIQVEGRLVHVGSLR